MFLVPVLFDELHTYKEQGRTQPVKKNASTKTGSAHSGW
jgi:hypothetical protein